MSPAMTADEIKRIRRSYGLTQKSFAKILGIGEASMVRYENGCVPSKANANLIRAAENKSFMLDCLRRDGELIPQSQREEAERIIYAELTFDDKGDVMDINEIYEITLQQEILNEQAAEVFGDLVRLRSAAQSDGDAALQAVYDDAIKQLMDAKLQITDGKHEDDVSLAEIRGKINAMRQLAKTCVSRAA